MLTVAELLDEATEEDLQRIANSIKLRDGEELTEELIQDIVTPHYIGPTWATNDDGSWYLPEHTLGWKIAGWCAEYLLNPQDDTKPWKFTPEQLRFILWWYAIDEKGKFLYQSGVLQRRKGWGKDPLLAVICLVEFVGPCRFVGWDTEGNVLTRPEKASLVLVSAVTKEQTSNTADMFPLLMSKKFIATYKVTPGIELIRAQGGTKKIMLLTGSYRAAEGKRSTFTLMNETHHWVAGNGGPKMYETIDGNTAKNPSSRYLAITNAYLPGEESVAESMRSDYESFKALGYSGGFLYDSVEAKARAPIGGPLLPLVLERMLGDSVWDTVETHIASMIRSIMKRSISPARSRRMWLNQVVADEDALYSPEDWDTNLDEDAMLSPGDEIILGLDGGKTDDSTVLMAIKPSTMEAFVLGMWEKPTDVKDETWIVDQSLVDEVVEMAHNRYEVIGFLSDVSGWETWIVRWEEEYASNYKVRASEARAIGYDMRSNLKEITHSNEALFKSITDGELRHDGDFRLRRHVLNARRRNNKWGVSFGKESRESDRKVDAYAALLLAYIGTVKYRIKPKKPEKKKGSRSFFM